MIEIVRELTVVSNPSLSDNEIVWLPTSLFTVLLMVRAVVETAVKKEG